MANYGTKPHDALTKEEEDELFATRHELEEKYGRPPSREEWEIRKALKYAILYDAGPRTVLHAIAMRQYPQLASVPRNESDCPLCSALAVRKACQHLCGPRVYPRPSHVRAEALRPWRGPVEVSLRIYGTTTGRWQSCL